MKQVIRHVCLFTFARKLYTNKTIPLINSSNYIRSKLKNIEENVEQPSSQELRPHKVQIPLISNNIIVLNTKYFHRAGGDQVDLVGQYEAKRRQKTTSNRSRKTKSNNTNSLILMLMLLMNVTYEIFKIILRPFIFVLKFGYRMCSKETTTMKSIQTYGIWLYQTHIETVFLKIEQLVIGYGHDFFFPEKPYPRGFIFQVLDLFWNLTGLFTLVFVLAVAFYPIITFLSVVIVLFILFQTIVYQGIVNYYYYFKNKNSG